MFAPKGPRPQSCPAKYTAHWEFQLTEKQFGLSRVWCQDANSSVQEIGNIFVFWLYLVSWCYDYDCLSLSLRQKEGWSDLGGSCLLLCRDWQCIHLAQRPVGRVERCSTSNCTTVYICLILADENRHVCDVGWHPLTPRPWGVLDLSLHLWGHILGEPPCTLSCAVLLLETFATNAISFPLYSCVCVVGRGVGIGNCNWTMHDTLGGGCHPPDTEKTPRGDIGEGCLVKTPQRDTVFVCPVQMVRASGESPTFARLCPKGVNKRNKKWCHVAPGGDRGFFGQGEAQESLDLKGGGPWA